MYDEDDDEARMRKGRREQIESTVLKTKPRVKFDDVIGLEKAKKCLKQKILYPILQPQLFTETEDMMPCKRLLLYGPPGTGEKTTCSFLTHHTSVAHYSLFKTR